MSGALTIWSYHAIESERGALGRVIWSTLLLPHDNRVSIVISRLETRGKMLEDFSLKSPSRPLAAEVAEMVTNEPL